MGGDGGQGPRISPWKITSCHLFPSRNWYGLPSRSNPPLELSGSAHACLTVEFYFSFSFLHVTGLAVILSSADAQADLRLCCLHATKSSFSQQGTYGMG